jgi:hypothetical protein
VHERPDADETMSSSSSLWHVWYREYETRWDPKVQAILDRFPDRADVIREHLKPTLVPLPAAVERFEVASEADVQWLTGALRDERRKWFCRPQRAPGSCPTRFLSRCFVHRSRAEPEFQQAIRGACMRVFGPRRVNEVLLT